MADTSITIAGAGILGLWQARALALAGYKVRVLEASVEPFAVSASRYAGAMLAPDCEAEAAPAIVRDLGYAGLRLWRAAYPGLVNAGTLVVALPRDKVELGRFARLTTNHERMSATRLQQLEPALAERFDDGLFYADEAHMDVAAALAWLLTEARRAGAEVLFGQAWDGQATSGRVIDCRGYGARAEVPGLRGVRGERALIATRDVDLARPVRLLHPRQPIYVVPQGDGRFVVGATVIEREDAGPATVRSTLDLLGHAYALHPGFAEAEILDIGAGVRPAFADNVPGIVVTDAQRLIHVNGAYRHGFLLAPVLAEQVVQFLREGTRGALMRVSA